MTENNKFQYCEEENGEFPFPYIQTDDGETIISLYDCWKHLNILCDKNEQLKKENEVLKERNQELYDKLQVTMSRHSLQMGETELIKHMIQEAYETERTQIGKNVLKQLMEAIE